MKTFFSLLLTVAFMGANAQKPFEGTVVYRLSENTYQAELDTSAITVYFGKNAIRINYGKQRFGGSQDILIDLDSGKMHELNLDKKTFATRKLFYKAKHPEAGSEKVIAGHPVIATDLSENGIAALVGSMSREQVLVYPANDLYYPVPPEYVSNIALSMVYNNKIVLGMTVIDRHKPEEAGYDTVRIEAQSVIPAQLPASLFRIPEDFSKEEEVVEVPEPVAIETDTTSPAILVPTPPPAPPMKKPNAVKKKTNTTKSPMRKTGKGN